MGGGGGTSGTKLENSSAVVKSWVGLTVFVCRYLSNTQVSGSMNGLAKLTLLTEMYPHCVACACVCEPHEQLSQTISSNTRTSAYYTLQWNRQQ